MLTIGILGAFTIFHQVYSIYSFNSSSYNSSLEPLIIILDKKLELECASCLNKTVGTRSKRQAQNVMYKSYYAFMFTKLQAKCECPYYIRPKTTRRKRSIEYEIDDLLDPDERGHGILTVDHAQQRHLAGAGAGGGATPAGAAALTTGSPKVIHYLCKQVGMTSGQQTLAGMCIYSAPGRLVFGVRQWHGLTSLVAALLITPMSIMIARYNKGFYIIKDGKLPLRNWYLVHITLLLPATWMHGSGYAALTRQIDVIGHSLAPWAKIHRALGFFIWFIMGFQILTGFLRPIRLIPRKIVNFLHYGFGYTQHILEIFICLNSCLIPGSPTSAHSILNKIRFGKPLHSVSTELLLSWIGFSTSVHLFQMIRIAIQDRKAGIRDRSLFPLIIPMLPTSSADIERFRKSAWMDRVILTIYFLVSVLLFFVLSVSMYQVFYDPLYYGFGPMSCTHETFTQLWAQGEEEGGCGG